MNPSPDSQEDRFASIAAEAVWVRRLALALAADMHAGEDIAQDALLAASSSSSEHVRNLRSWLARVVANLARRRRGAGAERVARERLAAHPERIEDSSLALERLETIEILSRAVRNLPEPYRTTVLLRWYEALSPDEIARRTGAPVRTIHTRVSRALSLLREDLDRRSRGDRSHWLSAWIPLLPKSSTVWPWALVMALKSKLAIAAVCVGALISLWFVFKPSKWADDRRASNPALAEPPASMSAPLPAELTTDAGSHSQRSLQPPSAPIASEPTNGLGVEVHGRCVDRNGRPVGDAEIELTELAWWEKESGIPRWVVTGDERAAAMLPRTRSTVDGRFSIDAKLPEESPHGMGVSITARKPGLCLAHERKFRSGRGELDVGDIVLEPGARAAGLVRDVLGNRCAGVRVYVQQAARTASAGSLGDETRSAPDGSFALENAPAAPCRLIADAGDLRTATLELDLGSSEPRLDIELVLPELHGADSISGMVVDPDGQPVPGAWLLEQTVSGPEPHMNVSTGCDDHGRFRIDGHAETVFELVAGDRKNRWCGVRATDIRSGTHDILLQLDGTRCFTLSVREGSGAPIERFGYERVSTVWNAPVRSEVETHPLGEVRLASDVTPFELRVFAPGRHSCALGTLDPEHLPGTVVAVLERACTLRGIVRSQGKGVAKAWVRLAESHLDDPSRDSRMGATSDPQALTDVDGRFELTVEGTGSVKLRAQHGADLSPVTESVPVRPGDDVDGLVIDIDQVGAVEGTVLRSDGSPGAGLAVAALHGGESVQSTRTDESGHFGLPGLPKGRYDVAVTFVRGAIHFGDAERSRDNDAQRWSCQVEPGRATQLQIHLLESARMRFMLDLPEVPRSTWRLELSTRTAGVAGTEIVDRETQGHEAIDVEILDPFDADLMLTSALPGWPQISMAKQSVGRGAHEVSVSLHAGRIEGVLAQPFAAEENVSLRWHEGALSASSTIKADATGRFVFACAPAGECRLERATRPKEARTVLVQNAGMTHVDGL